MKRYDYMAALETDIRNVIKWDYSLKIHEFDSRDEAEEYFNDELWTNDSVTGNGSGSYTFNTWEAEENICHNWDLIQEMFDEFGTSPNTDFSAEAIDVSIRCYLLGAALSKVLDEIEDTIPEWN